MSIGYLILVIIILPHYIISLNDELAKKLKKGLQEAENTINSISNEWSISNYPLFLKSCYMHKVSWELLKLRYQRKIIDSELTSKQQSFVISFTGSSVTAGHDSLFNMSTPIQAGVIMKNVFSILDINLDSRNVALGNNPCTPYDVCVKYFAGLDADIVHWEQSYFCDGKPIIEQFLRQASLIPSKPIVVFSESQTGNWPTEDCKKKVNKHVINNKENELLTTIKNNPIKLVSELNKDEYHRAWNFLGHYSHLYKSTGIQTFTHLKHESYKCQGPYIDTWGEGAASWHPSVLGHRLRASHHAYFWLLILVDAMKELQSSVTHRQLDAISKDIDHHLEKLQEPINPAKYISKFPDNAVCYTDYEPRSIRNVSLQGMVVDGLGCEQSSSKPCNKVGWNVSIYEDLVDKSLVKKSVSMGYQDYKWLLYGNKDSGPLHIDIALSKPAPIFLCETPGIWGQLPSGFDHIWKPLVDVYLTYNVKDKKKFAFSPGSATQYKFFYDKSLEICSIIKANAAQGKAPAGTHVLTIVPKQKTKAILAWIITGN